MNPKKYTLSFSDGGTNMVSYFEEVELTIQSGNWSKETMDGLSERVAEAVKKYGSGINQVLSGRYKQSHGYKWGYV